jgi:hypothetical protein
MDLLQGYGMWSDNVGTGVGTTRLWIDAPDRGELQLGPRSGANWLDWVQARTTRFSISLGRNTSPNGPFFEVVGGPTQLDNANITTDGSGALRVGTTATVIGGLSAFGGVARVGSNGTVGSFGVAPIVAQALSVGVTSTAAQTLVSFTPPANATYRINLVISFGNTSDQLLTAKVVCRDVALGTNQTNFFISGQTGIVLAGNNACTHGQQIATAPLVIAAGAAGTVSIIYQDPGGAPNDRVTCIVERLT